MKKGDLGGYVEKEDNLSHIGNAWIFENAEVFDYAKVYDNARVFDGAEVFEYALVYDSAMVRDKSKIHGSAWVYGNTEIRGDAIVSKTNDYAIFKNHWSSGRFFIWTKSNNMWTVGCFYGTGEELIEKAYKDSEISGKFYEKYVNFVNELLEMEQTF